MRPTDRWSRGVGSGILMWVMSSTASTDLERWRRQWQLAEEGLLEQKRQELQSLTDEQAREMSSRLLSLACAAAVPAWRQQGSGLVEQQRYFRHART